MDVFSFAFLLRFGVEMQEKPKIPPNPSLFHGFLETRLRSSTPFSTKMQQSRNVARIAILASAAALQRMFMKHENKQALCYV
jgi:hypothetical protein